MAIWDLSTASSVLEFDTIAGQNPNATVVDSNHHLVQWRGSGDDGFAQIFEINTY